MFGKTQADFNGALLYPESIVIARFYRMSSKHREGLNDGVLLAWGCIPIMKPASRQSPNRASEHHILNAGSHTIQLYEPPVPHPADIPIEPHMVSDLSLSVQIKQD